MAEELRAQAPPITPTVCGLYLGTPDDDQDPDLTRPNGLRLFRGNLARGGSYNSVVEQVALTLEHEAANWLGLDLDEPGA